jgi:hypothetical protein
MRPGQTAEVRFAGTGIEFRVAQTSDQGWVGGCTCCDGETVALVCDDVLEVRSRLGVNRFSDFEVKA